jgi:hypothetical protein
LQDALLYHPNRNASLNQHLLELRGSGGNEVRQRTHRCPPPVDRGQAQQAGCVLGVEAEGGNIHATTHRLIQPHSLPCVEQQQTGGVELDFECDDHQLLSLVVCTVNLYGSAWTSTLCEASPVIYQPCQSTNNSTRYRGKGRAIEEASFAKVCVMWILPLATCGRTWCNIRAMKRLPV